MKGEAMTIQQLLHLSTIVAKKARQLIPRSSNRSAFRVDDTTDSATDSQWEYGEKYVKLRLLAQRARSSQNDYRRLIALLTSDVGMHSKETEVIINKAVMKALRDTGIDIDKMERDLKAARRADKTHHKPTPEQARSSLQGDRVTPLEVHKANAKNAVRYRIGNCGENASLAFVMFAEYPGPKGDHTLPDLDRDLNQRPRVEKCSCTGRDYDHAFVVVNRPAGNISNTASWFTGTVIICDSWWFHEGDALLASDRTGEKNDLLEYIEDAASDGCLKLSGAEIRLGQGHSERYKKGKYKDVNYYQAKADVIEEKLQI
jgi:hypothetical protein